MSLDPISAAIDFGSKIVDRIWPDATEKQKAEAQAVIAQLAHTENIFAKEVEDRDSARKREAEIAVSESAPTINKIITPVLAIGTILLSFLLFYIVAFGFFLEKLSEPALKHWCFFMQRFSKRGFHLELPD